MYKKQQYQPPQQINIKEPSTEDINDIFIKVLDCDISLIKKIIYEKGINLNVRNKQNRSLVHQIIIRNEGTSELQKLKTIQYLYENGASIDCYDNENRTPLHYACMKQYVTICEYEIKKKVNLDCQNNNEKTPLHYAVIGKKEDDVSIEYIKEVKKNYKLTKQHLEVITIQIDKIKRNITEKLQIEIELIKKILNIKFNTRRFQKLSDNYLLEKDNISNNILLNDTQKKIEILKIIQNYRIEVIKRFMQDLQYEIKVTKENYKPIYEINDVIINNIDENISYIINTVIKPGFINIFDENSVNSIFQNIPQRLLEIVRILINLYEEKTINESVFKIIITSINLINKIYLIKTCLEFSTINENSLFNKEIT